MDNVKSIFIDFCVEDEIENKMDKKDSSKRLS